METIQRGRIRSAQPLSGADAYHPVQLAVFSRPARPSARLARSELGCFDAMSAADSAGFSLDTLATMAETGST